MTGTKTPKPMHTVCLRLDASEYEGYLIDRSFHALSHIHNVLVKHARKLLIQLEHDQDYQQLRTEYTAFLKNHKNDGKLSKTDASYQKELSDRMKTIRQDMGLTEYSFQSYIKKCAKLYNKLLSSQQVQKEATRVWQSVEKYLFGDGKAVHFKKYRDFDTIGGKSTKNGMRFDKETFSAVWMGRTYKVKRPKKSSMDYVYKALSSDISYCDVKRRMFPNGRHYYIVVVLKGPAPKKLTAGDNTCGIDPGVSTMAAVSDEDVYLEELAPDIGKYNKEIIDTQYHMDLSKRASNPDKYNPDGTIDKSNHDRWEFSKTYIRLGNRLKYLYRVRSDYIKQSHSRLINKLLKDARNFYIEDMDYKALAKRSKNTERSDRIYEVKAEDGSIKQVHKYKRKIRFGRSLNNRAPALFIHLLEQKAALYGGSVTKIATKDYKASQYDHSTDTCTKAPLSQRTKTIDGRTVQRDLYSAFLILNTDDTLTHPDRDKCISTFDSFVRRQDKLISEMKKSNISMKQCFGF